MGPVQVLVIRLDRADLHGDVMSELTRLRKAGIVRLVDLLLVTRHADGTLETLEMPAGTPERSGELTAAILGRDIDDGLNDADQVDAADGGSRGPTWSLGDAVPPGADVAVALIEHMWAGPLRDAIHRTGGAPIDETWLAADDVETLEAVLRERERSAPQSAP